MDFRPFNLADTIAAAEGIRSRQAQTAYYDQRATAEREAADEKKALRELKRQAVRETPGEVTGSAPMPGGREVERAPSKYEYDQGAHRQLLLGAGFVDEAELLQSDQMAKTVKGLEFITRAAPHVYDQGSYDRFRDTLERAGLANPGELPPTWSKETGALLAQMAGTAEEQYGEITRVGGMLGQYGPGGKFHKIGAAEKPDRSPPPTREIDGVLHQWDATSGRWTPARRDATGAELGVAEDVGFDAGMQTGAGARGPSGGRGPGMATGNRLRDMVAQSGVPVTTGGGRKWQVDESLGYPVLLNAETGEMKSLPKNPGAGTTYDVDPLSGIVVIMDASGQPIGRMNLDQLPEVAPGAAPPAAGAAPGAAPGAAQQASPEQWKQAADVYLQTKLAEGYDVEQIRAAMAQMGFPPEMIPPPVPPEQAPPPVARSPIPGEDEERRAKAAETRARIEAVNQIPRVPGAQDRRAEKQQAQAERVAALPAEADQVAASGDPRQIVDWMQDNLADLKKNHRAVYLRHRDTFERALQAVSQRPMARATPAAE